MVLISGTGMEPLPHESLEPELLKLTIGFYDNETTDAGWGENNYHHPILIPAKTTIRFPNGIESLFSDDVIGRGRYTTTLGPMYKKPISPSHFPESKTSWDEPIEHVPIEDIAVVQYSKERQTNGQPIYTITRPLLPQEIESAKAKYDERIRHSNKLMDEGIDAFIANSTVHKGNTDYARQDFREAIQGAIWNAQRATLGVCNFNYEMLGGVLDAMERQFEVFSKLEPHKALSPGLTLTCGAIVPAKAIGHIPKRMFILASYVTNPSTRGYYQGISEGLYRRLVTQS